MVVGNFLYLFNHYILGEMMQFYDFFFEGVGSSINYRYAVNTSLVKPLTLAAGGASYALIKHPEGLKCDSRQ